MVIHETHTQVLIVGAGPSGLMMAAQLLRYGIQPVIIDSKDGITTHSKALGVQARSLEIYRQMGLAEQVVNDGKPARGISFHYGGKKEAALSLHNVGEGLTPFPYILMYQQNKNERLLLDHLTQNCCTVYWHTTLVSLRQNAGGAAAVLKSGDKEHALKCDWVIGADGAHSMVRSQINAPFKGDTYPHYFYLADVKLGNDEMGGDRISLYLDKNGMAGFFPMPETNQYRIIGSLPAQFENKEDVKLGEVLPFIEDVTHTRLDVDADNWFTTYKLHHRMAEKFREQRCFLIGDAAHIHSPVAAQGMNTGLQDAFNLAWKLAGVINGHIRPVILDSYAAERMPVAKELLQTTDRVFNIIMSSNWFVKLFKKFLLFKLLASAWKSENIKTAVFKRVSQIGIAYRDNSINLHLSHSEKVRAGDRLPYVKLFDEKKEEETDLHAWCAKPGFTLIVLGRFDEMFLFTLAKWITQQYPGILNFFYLPPSGKNIKVFETFGADPHRQKAIIVRPDMHIGYINDVVDIGMMNNYLQNVMGIVPAS